MEFFDRYKDDMTAYVNDLLAQYNVTGNPRARKIGYSRSEHIMRVYKWAKKLYDAYPDKSGADLEVLSIAAVFHDVGYCRESDRHAEASSEICREYLLGKGYPLSKTEQVCSVIARHSDKHIICDDIPIELVLLLEADMLDDMGAMGLVIDVWMEAVCGEKVSFQSILQHMEKYTLAEMQRENPMRTDEGRRIWEEKKALTEAFLRSYKEDFSIEVF